MFRQHWGDLPVILDTESGIAALEREQITKPRALEIEGAKLHQLLPPQNLGICREDLFRLDPLTHHSIQLQVHNRKLRTLLQSLHEQPSQDGMPKTIGDAESENSLSPSLPPRPQTPPGFRSLNQPKNFYGCNEISDFAMGRGKPPPELPFTVVHQLLRKTVAIICVHTGFDTSSEIVLDTLTSVVHQFFTKMCSLLRLAVDREALTGNTGFVDPMEEVFHKMGLGSVMVLHNFYQSRMVGYHRHLLRTCVELEAEFLKLSNPQQHRQRLDSKTHRPAGEEPGVCEIKFPISEEMDVSCTVSVVGGTLTGTAVGGQPVGAQGEQSPPPLEELHGALQGMEGSTSLKEEAMKWLPPQVALRGKDGSDATQSALDPDEIINVSDTPEHASGSEMEQITPSVSCDPLTLSPASDPMVQFCKPPKKKKKK